MVVDVPIPGTQFVQLSWLNQSVLPTLPSQVVVGCGPRTVIVLDLQVVLLQLPLESADQL